LIIVQKQYRKIFGQSQMDVDYDRKSEINARVEIFKRILAEQVIF
jgi:hypothetical protein